ncbi:WD domain-containing protein [Stachybotrys elegans]|uniref:WD domain-containing protein n=1 Tax=Stachybotrys elegans TaxID=80388 RepID=A0A8K0SRS5_9HYPO|nr:WD domain-containing protein [Stachybotrys elegans]
MLSDNDANISQNGSTASASSLQQHSSAPQRQNLPGITNGSHKSVSATNGSSGADGNPNHGRPKTYFGHDHEEVTRILIQALSDMGYHTAAESVSRDSGCSLESPTVASFRTAVLNGAWAEAEALLVGATGSGVRGSPDSGLVLASGSDRDLMRCWLRQQKYLELLEQRDTPRALKVLREELTPLYHDTAKLHFLSSLLMCRSTDDLRLKADWDGANGESRRLLLSQLSRCISPSVMLPEHRLAVLLQQVKQSQIDLCLYHTAASSPSLYSDHSCDQRHFPTEAALDLTDLGGEAWQVKFSHDGSKLAACGSKEEVVIWDTTTFKSITLLRGHEDGVGSLAWSPDDTMIVTCCQDKHARVWDVKSGSLIKKTHIFAEPVIGCVWAPDSKSFVVGTLDKSSSLCKFNVHDDETIDWGKKHRVQDLCGSPNGRWLVAVDDGLTAHVYNALTRELEFSMDLKARPTSVSISEDSRHLLINKNDGEAQLVDIMSRTSVQKYVGHSGGTYQIRSSFGGANESFVISASENGSVYIWHKSTGVSLEVLTGHTPRSNAVSWNPGDPCMLASCGDDGLVKMYVNPFPTHPSSVLLASQRRCVASS